MEAVLVVDDDDIVLRVMSKIVDRAGIRYFATTDPREALDAAEHGSFTILLTDLVMDDMDGVALFRAARKHQPLLRGIATSAFLDQDKLTTIIASGFDDCLIKPVRSDRLVQSMHSSFLLARRWKDLMEHVKHVEQRSSASRQAAQVTEQDETEDQGKMAT